MARPIKFRVWDGERMHEAPNLMCRLGDGALMVWYGPGQGVENAVPLSGKGAILLQFTGLHDADGREIYEGDVIQAVHERYGRDGMHVYFKDGGFRYHWGLSLNSSAAEGHRVIGNIHEHPELTSSDPLHNPA